MHRQGQSGFTLIELMVAVAILAILAAIVWPGYQQHVIRGQRAAAQAQMLDLASRQQQFLLANRSYASQSQLEAAGYALPAEVAARYAYEIELGSAGGYLIRFVPLSGSTQANDGTLTLDHLGNRGPSGKW